MLVGGRAVPKGIARIRNRSKTILEKMFKSQTSSTIACCIDIWSNASEDVTEESIYDCIDSLTPSAQKVVEIISDGVTPRQGRAVNAM